MNEFNEKPTQLLKKSEIAKLISESYKSREPLIVEKKQKIPTVLIVLAIISGLVINTFLLAWLGYLVYIIWRL